MYLMHQPAPLSRAILQYVPFDPPPLFCVATPPPPPAPQIQINQLIIDYQGGNVLPAHPLPRTRTSRTWHSLVRDVVSSM